MNSEMTFEFASIPFSKNLDRRERVLKTRELKRQEQPDSPFFSLYSDSKLHLLSKERQWAWKRILSSLATGEGQEFQVMEPLSSAFQSDPIVTKWFVIHSNDEKNHCEILQKYLKDNFNFEKKKPTITDQIVYEGLGPFIQGTITRKPTLGIALINAYELAVVSWLQELIKTAHQDSLTSLTSIFEMIIEDEMSHIAAMGHLVQSLREKGYFSSSWDRIQIRAFVQVLRFDMMQGPLAIHNREMTKAFKILEINPNRMNHFTKQAANRTIKILQGKN